MFRYLKTRVANEEFFPGVLSFFISPYYITRSSLVKQVADIAPKLQGSILDFGCGSKPYESLFINASSYTGVDIELSGHDHANSEVDYFYNGKTLPFPDQNFDNLISFETFEHVVNLFEMVPEISRVVKPGGMTVITVPFVFPEHEMPYDFRRFTGRGLASLLEENGFEVLQIRRYPSTILTLVQMFIHYVFTHLSQRNSLIKTLLHLALSVPSQVVAYVTSAVLPRGADFYIGSMVIVRRK